MNVRGLELYSRSVRHAAKERRLSPDVAAAACELRNRFDEVAPFTVGAEEELLLVDPETFAAAPAAEFALVLAEGDCRLTHELRASQLESITPVCATVPELERELVSVRRQLVDRLGGALEVMAVGTHPLDGEPGPVSRPDRYRRLLNEHPWAARHALTCGLHVHVAVGGARRALAVYNAMRSYLPELVALGANSPFYHGEDSGLATVRPKLNQTWSRSGVPPAFASWQDLAEFVVWGLRGGAFPNCSYHWWDLRLSAAHGTIEVRAADAQTRAEDAATVAALVQSLVCELAERYDSGERLPIHPGERIAENMWLATRDGIDGHLIDLDSGSPIPAAERLRELVDRLLPVASTLGCDRELQRVARLVVDGGGAGRQRRMVVKDGLDALARALVAETSGDAETGARSERPLTPPSRRAAAG